MGKDDRPTEHDDWGPMPDTCAHCKGPIMVSNPTGNCNHNYWPDCLTDEAKWANGYRPSIEIVWRIPLK